MSLNSEIRGLRDGSVFNVTLYCCVVHVEEAHSNFKFFVLTRRRNETTIFDGIKHQSNDISESQ